MKQHEIAEQLKKAYSAEFETAQNYTALSVNLESLQADLLKKYLGEFAMVEFDHARRLARRIHVLGSRVPFADELAHASPGLDKQQFSDLTQTLELLIKGEEEAIKLYSDIVASCTGVDYVTQDLCIDILSAEEEHRRNLLGYLSSLGKG